MFLTDRQLRDLTGRQRPGAQRRALTRMGIPHHVRPDGRPVVVADQLTGDPGASQPTEPNWAALAALEPSDKRDPTAARGRASGHRAAGLRG
jgi:hypothetical protein